MDDELVTQAVVNPQAALNPDQGTEHLALFNPDGSPYVSNDTGPAVTTATAIGTAAKTTTSDAPAVNTFVAVKFTNGNSASSPTVAFNGGSAISILLGGTASTGAKMTVAANGVVVFWFDGTNLHQLGTVA